MDLFENNQIFRADLTHSRGVSSLSPQQHRLAEAALNYHALLNPGCTIKFEFYIGRVDQTPALTDVTTLTVSAAEGCGEPVASIVATSIARGRTAAADRQKLVRYIRLPNSETTPRALNAVAKHSLKRRAYDWAEMRAPIALDTVRELLVRRRERQTRRLLLRQSRNLQTFAPTAHDFSDSQQPRSILFGLHWFQTGGAETWALKTISLAKEAGFLPIVVTDKNSMHPLVTRPELNGCVIVTLSYSDEPQDLDVPLLEALFSNFSFAGIFIHHCQWLYECLPYIKLYQPEVPTLDSLHIIEYLYGGYPGVSCKFDEFIDEHHVISEQLVEWMVENQNVTPAKIHLAPLAQLTAQGSEIIFRSRQSADFTISFIGRISRQKRPEVFIALVKRLVSSNLKIRAIIHGEGELQTLVDVLIRKYKLENTIEIRTEEYSVSKTLKETDLLVISSINEGLTLTTFEALNTGVPVLSADVGSQSSLVPRRALVPRWGYRFVRVASKKIEFLSRDENSRLLLWSEERALLNALTELPDSTDFVGEVLKTWAK